MSEHLNKIAKGEAATDTADDVLHGAAATSPTALKNDNSDMISEKLQAAGNSVAKPAANHDSKLRDEVTSAKQAASEEKTLEVPINKNNKQGDHVDRQEWEPIDTISSNPDDGPRDVEQMPELIARHPTHAASNSQPGAHRVDGPGHCDSSLRQGLQPLEQNDVASTIFDSSYSTTLDAFVVQPEELNMLPENNGNAHVERQDGIQEIVDGISMPSRRTKNGNGNETRSKWFFPVIALILVLGCVILVVVLVAQSKAKDTRSTTAPTQNVPEVFVYPPFRDDLNAATLKALKQGQDTPESRANDWMWNDPNLDFYSKQRQERRFGLVALYYATQGDQWFQNRHWLEYDVSECEWFSKTTTNQPACDEDTDAMAVLDLHSNNLNGTLPKNFWNIKPKYLDISRNLLGGTMPPFPANILWLEHFIVSHNQFEGHLVGESGFEPTNLLTAAFDDNKFVGNSENGGALYPYIHNIQFLNFTVNLIQGAISPNLQHLTDLRYLGGGHNRLEGGMVSEIGMLTKLEDFDYSGNPMLTGTIPTELNLLTNLLTFDITETGLTGAIPEAFCDQADQELLQVEANCSSMKCCT